MNQLKNLSIIILALLVLTACGGGGGASTPAATVGDVSGVWSIIETNKTHDCILDPGLKSHTLTVQQSGSSLTVIDSAGNSFSGTLSGKNLSWTGSYDEAAPDGTAGETSLNPMSATVDSSCDSLSGTANWTWTDTSLSGSGYACTGTTTFNGSRSPAIGCGDDSGTDTGSSDTTPPSTPVNLAGAATSNVVSLKWVDATDNVGVTGYSIFRNGVFLQNVSVAAYSNTDLFASTQYCYTVQAYDAAGNKSAQSTEFCLMTMANVGDAQAPTIPTNLVATAASANQINLSWLASSDNVAVTSYNIYRNGGFIKSVTGTSASDINLTAATNYCYRVLANDAAGNSSSQSVQVCKFTQSPAVTVPVSPSNILASNITHNSAKLSWTDNSNNETGFEIGTCSGLPGTTGGGLTYCAFGFNRIATVIANTYTFTNLQPSTSYKYYVRAYNSAGESDNREVRFTTTAAPSTSTLTITNTFTVDSGLNQVLQLRLETIASDVFSDANELLSPDDTCIYLGPKSISPGHSTTYTIFDDAAVNGYYVFIGLGVPDGGFCSISGYFEKRMSSMNANNQIFYLFQLLWLDSNTVNGNDVELKLGYSGSNLVTRLYINGVFQNTINFVVSYSDLTTN